MSSFLASFNVTRMIQPVFQENLIYCAQTYKKHMHQGKHFELERNATEVHLLLVKR